MDLNLALLEAAIQVEAEAKPIHCLSTVADFCQKEGMIARSFLDRGVGHLGSRAREDAPNWDINRRGDQIARAEHSVHFAFHGRWSQLIHTVIDGLPGICVSGTKQF